MTSTYKCKDCDWKIEFLDAQDIKVILTHEKTHRKKYECEY